MNYVFKDPGFVRNALRVFELVRLILATNMTSHLLSIGGVILYILFQIFSKFQKTFVAFHPVSISVLRIHFFLQNLLSSFICLTSYTI